VQQEYLAVGRQVGEIYLPLKENPLEKHIPPYPGQSCLKFMNNLG